MDFSASRRAEEMRKFSRFPFIKGLRIDVFDNARNLPLGFAADVSLGGLRLIGEEPFKVGEQYEIRLEVPKSDLTLEQQIVLKVVCQWTRKNFRRGLEQGLRVVEPSRAFENLVNTLSHSLGLSETSLPKRRV